jgi:large subunit ribosomal protein L18
VRKKVSGTPERPRLVVLRSSKHIYAQLVDDTKGLTLFGASDRSEGIEVEGKGKTAKSFALGRLIAAKAKTQGITTVVFDRGGYQYHGRVKAVADGARKGGLEF